MSASVLVNPVARVAAAFSGDPGRPALTFFDDATGERLELSWTSLENWAAKTANLLRFELGVQAGDEAGVALPLHWQAATVLLGCAWAGLRTTVADPAGPLPVDGEVVFCRADRMADALAEGAPEVLGLSLAPMGRRIPAADVPAGGLDYAVGVPGQGDRWVPDAPAGADDEVLDGIAVGALVATDGLGPRDRVLVTGDWSTAAAVVAGLWGPLLAGAGVVLCARPDPALLAARAGTEKVTATLGVDLAGVPRLG